MFNWLSKIIQLFKKSNKQLSFKEQDKLLLYPYIDEKTIKDHPLIDEYNLARLFSTQNYLNHRIYPSNNHLNLKPFAEQNKKLSWIGIISDIKRPREENDTPILLIDKLALFENGKAKFLDNHVWLNTKYLKFIKNQKQVIAIGEAICGISKVGTYMGKTNNTKYGLQETILLGSGIFVGKKPRSDNETDLSAKFVTDYDRHNDWFLKLTNLPQNNFIDIEKCTPAEFNRLFNLPGHVNIKYQDSRHNNFINRRIGQTKLEQRIKKREQEKTTLEPIKKKVEKVITNHSGPLKRYSGKFYRYTYINEDSNDFTPIIVFINVTDELNQPVADKLYFSVNPCVIQAGKLHSYEKVNFSTKSINPVSPEKRGILKSLNPINKEKNHVALPTDEKALIGFIMFSKNDQTFEHLPFLEEYRAWAKENKINLPKQQDKKLANLKNKQKLMDDLNIKNPNELENLLKQLLIHPSYISNNIPYYDKQAENKIQRELKLRKMLENIKHNKHAVTTQTLSLNTKDENKSEKISHTVFCTQKGNFVAPEFDTLSAQEIKEKINELAKYRQKIYLRVKRIYGSHDVYLNVRDIEGFKIMFSDEIRKLR